MLSESFLYPPLAFDGVFVEQDAKRGDVKWELGPLLCDENGRLVQRVRVAKLVVHIGILRRDLCYNELRFQNLPSNIRDNEAWPICLVGSEGPDLELIADRLDDLRVEFVVRFGELHYDERSGSLGLHCEI